MTVKELITQLLSMPMDSKVQIAFETNTGDYKHQDIYYNPVIYEACNTVGILGYNNDK